ncbi:MAG: discoidin domain-containing protein [Kiritimatiellae bacterium]|nr:discoidin domain-containing protein [Kiritimatiellia bacterium]
MKSWIVWSMAVLASVTGWGASEESEAWRARTAWFREAKYGVFTHYLSQQVMNPGDIHSDGVARSWDVCVDGFDVRRYADAMKRMGAGYVVFTVYQGRRNLAAPLEALDRLFGTKPGEGCSRRDLVMEIADALAERGIPLLLYWTGDGPDRDDPKRNEKNGFRRPIPMEWVEKWAKVLECCACRYGTKVKGWWIDGCYVKHGGLGYTPEKLRLYEQAIRKGNPDAIVAFNNPISCDTGPIQPYMPFEDYTAGEMNNLSQCPDGSDIGRQWHTLTFLGSPFWGDPGVRYSLRSLGQYVHLVNAGKGVVTFDVICYWDGGLDRSQVNTLARLRAELEKYRSPPADPANLAYCSPARVLTLRGEPLGCQVFCRDQPLSATDGDPGTVIQGCYEWPWQLEVDLGGEKTFSHVEVTYGSGRFATRYRVSVSSDGKEWRTVCEGDNDNSHSTAVSFRPVTARFVRYAALKPDGEGQRGIQMAVAEIAVKAAATP